MTRRRLVLGGTVLALALAVALALALRPSPRRPDRSELDLNLPGPVIVLPSLTAAPTPQR